MRPLKIFACIVASAIFLGAGCKNSTHYPGVTAVSYGIAQSGEPITLYRLRNASGMEVEIINYGAIVASIKVADRAGRIEEVTLGYDTLEGWESDHLFRGATVGRYANRIAQGRFALDGRTYHLPVNNGANSLHGGWAGFNKRVWSARTVTGEDGAGVEFTLVSKDGDQGYPGTLTAQVTFMLGTRNELRIDYRATTDAPTVVNLTNHTCFSLNGSDAQDHEIQVHAGRYTPTDTTRIPTGELAPVEGTPLDFRKPAPMGARLDDPLLASTRGYDHNYVLDGAGLREAANVHDPGSGRVLEVLTTEPGLQFFFPKAPRNSPDGSAMTSRSGFCLETQHFPDSPNHPHFPSTVLRPGEVFTSTTIYRFSVR